MMDLLLVIFFLSLMVFAVAIYKPSLVKMNTRQAVAKVLGPIVAILFILVMVAI